MLDEVQKAPDLLSAVKMAVDSRPGHTRFILSGSANLLLMRQVSESLAGRAVYFVLDPITLGEVNWLASSTLLADALAQRWPRRRNSQHLRRIRYLSCCVAHAAVAQLAHA